MRPETRQVLQWLASETQSLLVSVDALWESDFNEQSRVSEWTKGQVVTHLARGADTFADRLAHSCPSLDSAPRDGSANGWDSTVGGDRPGAVLIGDIVESIDRLSQILEQVSDKDWYHHEGSDDQTIPLDRTRWLWLWLCEVTVHHVDLGSHFGELPFDLQATLLDYAVQLVQSRGDWPALAIRPTGIDKVLRIHPSHAAAVEVAGTCADLLAWITGRDRGDGVSCSVDPLPARPFWL
ncbi:maleylpyruvate isomerase family mycothiol-dependent enzyme [Rhodococcus erythropolis]|nr:maleylpyruvate isomerase family mycothiol-dependent enzyme [Rhodococcus erythropolis]